MTTRWALHPHASTSYQEPVWPRVVVLSEMKGSWWADLPRTCQHGACGGRLMIELDDLLPGSVLCSLCGREVAEVISTTRRAPVIEQEPKRGRGRPPKTASTGPRCIVCHERQARPGQTICRECLVPGGRGARS